MSEWKETQIKNFGRVITGYTPATNIHELWDGEVLFYTPADFHDDVYCSKTERKITEKALSNDRIVQENSLMVTCIASIGKIALAKKRGISNQQINTIIFNDDFDPKYCYYLIKQNINELIKLAGITAVPIVNKTEFEKISLRHHSDKTEQRQIALILSTCDVVIEKTQATIAKYKAIKQGMLHDLFTRGIDITTGKLRPKYEDAPALYKPSKLGMVPREWAVDSIENVSKRIWIGLVTTMTTHYVKNGIPLIRNNNIRDNYIESADMIQLDKTFSENNAQRYVHEGDIVTVHTGDIGTSAIINKDLDPAHGFATINTTVNEKIINNELLCYYFNSIEFKNRIEMYATGDGRSNLNLYDFLYILIPFPKNIDEQKLIAERLNSLNQKIHTEQIYLYKLQQLKAGLMCDLLSGKKMVKVPEKVLTQTEN